MAVRVQHAVFDSGAEINAFAAHNRHSGALATFIGQMRDFRESTREPITAMTLDYYPGMAERELEAMMVEARGRWALDDILVIHRYGQLAPGDPIVLVAVASAHRKDAFAACEFLMDWLKTKAPFWKKETTAQGASWVDAREADTARAERWKS